MTTINTAPTPKKNNLLLIIIIALAVLVMCLCCVVPAISAAFSPKTTNEAPTAAPRNTQAQNVADTPAPTAPLSIDTPLTPLSLSLTQFMNKYNNATDIQKKDFIPQSKGKSVDWTGKISNVSEDGTITVDIPNTLASAVSLKGVSPEDAVKLSKGQTIHFTGQITDIIDLLGMHIYLEGVQLSSAPQPTDAAQPTDAPSASSTQQQDSTTIISGTYLVGSEIKPGIYKSEGSDSCYWVRLKDLSGDFGAILANGNAKGQFYVEVKATDYALETHCALVPLASVTPVTELPKTIPAGMYLVGKDIQPGTYKGTTGTDSSDSCYWARLKDVSGGFDSIIANGNPTGQFYIQVSQSDFALSTTCDLEYTGK